MTIQMRMMTMTKKRMNSRTSLKDSWCRRALSRTTLKSRRTSWKVGAHCSVSVSCYCLALVRSPPTHAPGPITSQDVSFCLWHLIKKNSHRLWQTSSCCEQLEMTENYSFVYFSFTYVSTGGIGRRAQSYNTANHQGASRYFFESH